MAPLALTLTALLLAPAAPGAALIDPGPFAPTQVRLEDGREVDVPAETHAVYRMLTQEGRIHGRNGSPPPSEDEVREGILLRRRHEPIWTAHWGDRPRTPEAAYVFPVEGGHLARRSGYRPGHRAEDVFAPPGRAVLAPAAMLVLHAGYLSKTAGEAVVGFIPAGPGGVPAARYLALVHLDAEPARAHVGQVVEAGTVVGFIASGDEALLGNALTRPPHLHFAIREEVGEGRLQGIRLWDLLRRAARVPGRNGPHSAP